MNSGDGCTKQIMENENYYDVLGVPKQAEAHQIKEAFRKLALQYHPDRNQGDSAAASRMQRINEAYAVLSNPDKRRQYDLMYRQFGDAAQTRFRQTYSAQDVFSGSDIQQIFEELSRAFGVRGFDDIFNDIQKQAGSGFRKHESGYGEKSYVFSGSWSMPGAQNQGLLGNLVKKMLQKITGIQLPVQGENIHDTIVLNADDATRGGPYAYYLSAKDKKLVVHIPPGVKDKQTIRLAGLGHDGSGGAQAGDLMLKVKIRGSFVDYLKQNWAAVKRSLKG